MRLRIVTTVLFVVGLVMLMAWPLVWRGRPAPDAPRQELAEFSLRFLVYFALTALVFLATAVCALLVVRRAREEYAEQAGKNLRGLIEGTLRDHGRKGD